MGAGDGRKIGVRQGGGDKPQISIFRFEAYP